MEAAQINGHSPADRLERAFDAERWDRAETLCRKAITADPGDHWWWTRLATSLYEQGKYSDALRASERALELQPRCPLVLWDHACCLDMVGCEREAIAVWKRLLSRGVERIAFDECGEGRRWAQALLNDCRYRIAKSLLDLRDRAGARRYLAAHLNHRKSGQPSIYQRNDVVRFARQLASRPSADAVTR